MHRAKLRSLYIKTAALLLSFSLLLTAVIGNTFAQIVVESPSMQNTFISGVDPTGDLVISKTVSHTLGDGYEIPEDVKFRFAVDLGQGYAGKSIETSLGSLEADENGNIILFIRPDETVRVKDILIDTPVTITETPVKGFTADGGNVKTCTVDSGDNVITFTNVYRPDPVASVNLNVIGTKILEGRDWQEGDSFTFLLEYKLAGSGSDWQKLDTATVSYELIEVPDPENPDWTILVEKPDYDKFSFTDSIKALAFTAAGEYSFRLSEVEGSIGGVSYDKVISYFDVLVGDAMMDGVLEIISVEAYQNAAASYDEAADTFTVDVTVNNKYAPVGTSKAAIIIDKSVTSLSGEEKSFAGYTFELYDENGKLVAVSDKTSASGEAILELLYEAKDAGSTFRYTLKETNAGHTLYGMKYDEREYEIYVSVVDNLDGTVSAFIFDTETDGSRPTDLSTTTTGTVIPAITTTFSPIAGSSLPSLGAPTTTASLHALSTTATSASNVTTTTTASTTTTTSTTSTSAATTTTGTTSTTLAATSTILTTTTDPVLTTGTSAALATTSAAGTTSGTTVAGTSTSAAATDQAITTTTASAPTFSTTLTTQASGSASSTMLTSIVTTLTTTSASSSNSAPSDTTTDSTTQSTAIGTISTTTSTIAVRMGTSTLTTGALTVTSTESSSTDSVTTTTAASSSSDVYSTTTSATSGALSTSDTVTSASDTTAVTTCTGDAISSTDLTTTAAGSTVPTSTTTSAAPTTVTTTTTTSSTTTATTAANTREPIVIPDWASDTYNAVFENIYDPEDVKIVLSGEKKLTGREMKEGEFSFDLFSADEMFAVSDNAEPVSTASNDAEGAFSFLEITFDEVGTYRYIVTEDSSDKLGGITYDPSVYRITVTVTDAKGALRATVDVTDALGEDAKLVFSNTYKPEKASVILSGKKTLVGAELEENMFTFLLYKSDNKFSVRGKEIDDIANSPEGTFAFKRIEFEEAGEFYYAIVEDSSEKIDGMSYDKTVYGVKVVVTDDGEGKLESVITYYKDGSKIDSVTFANSYTEPPKDSGGDSDEPDDPDSPGSPSAPGKPDAPTNDLRNFALTWILMFVSFAVVFSFTLTAILQKKDARFKKTKR